MSQKLPVLNVVQHTFVEAGRRFAEFAALCLAGAILATSLILATQLLVTQLAVQDLVQLAIIIGAFVPLIVLLVVGILVAVRWHRLVLLNEPVLSGLLPPWKALRGYGLRGLALYGALAVYWVMIIQLVNNTLRLGTMQQGGTPYGLLAVFAAAGVLAMLTLGRFALVFPATAVGDGRFNFIVSWIKTEGSSWRMLLSWVLCMLPFEVLRSAIAQLGIPPNVSGVPVGSFLGVVLTFGEILITTGFISLAYKHFAAGMPNE